MNDVKRYIWSGPQATAPDANRRALQRAYVTRLGQIVNPPAPAAGAAALAAAPAPPAPFLAPVNLAQSDLPALSRAQLRSIQAQAKSAAATSTNATIKAPIRATVLFRDVEVGSPVSSILNLGANATLILTLGDIDRVFVRGKVDEADIWSIKQENVATFTVDAFPDQTFQGRVAQVRLAATSVQNVVTYSVMVQAPNPRQMLLPGMTANVRIVTDRLFSRYKGKLGAAIGVKADAVSVTYAERRAKPRTATAGR